MQSDKTVLVALSGGVDSSVTARLLLEQGYRVEGAHMSLWDPARLPAHLRSQKDPHKGVRDLGELLGIPVHIVPLEEEFSRRVIGRFISDYSLGRTPNPCVECNKFLKFGALYDLARKMGLEHLATGHYARTLRLENGRWSIRNGADLSKNQSYYLYGLRQEAIARTLFPLGEYTKEQVRELARQFQLPMAEQEESQEICFIPEDNYREFLKREEFSFQPGVFRDSSGAILGHHRGKENYTIGQRKGLGLSHSEPLYVLAIEENGDVIVGPRSETVRSRFQVEQLIFQGLPPGALAENRSLHCRVQIRYRSPPVEAEIRSLGLHEEISWNGEAVGHLLEVESLQPVYAVTPGQSAVFYPLEEESPSDIILAGGIIRKENSESVR